MKPGRGLLTAELSLAQPAVRRPARPRSFPRYENAETLRYVSEGMICVYMYIVSMCMIYIYIYIHICVYIYTSVYIYIHVYMTVYIYA